MNVPYYEEVEHTADCAIHVRGTDLASLFVNAARGMMSLIGAKAGEDGTRSYVIHLRSFDAESLLVDWLSELLYLSDRDGVLFDGFEIRRLEPNEIEAIVTGKPASEPEMHIKAVTFHNLEIKQTDGGYEATVVFDV